MELIKKDSRDLLNQGKIRIKLDSNWNSNEFGILFDRFDQLYEYYYECLFFNSLLDDELNAIYSNEQHKPSYNYILSSRIIYETIGLDFFKKNDRLHRIRMKNSEKTSTEIGILRKNYLKVKSIKFSSPGFTDLIGIGAVLEHLKEILMHYLPNKNSKENTKILEQKRIKLQIENLTKMGFSEIEIRKIILLEEIYVSELKDLLKEGKITAIEYSEN